jgi:hypothetical protein
MERGKRERENGGEIKMKYKYIPLTEGPTCGRQ